MLLNKKKISLFIFFMTTLFHAQPGMEELTNAPRIIFTISDSMNNKIKFITQDFLNFKSSDNKYSFFLTMKEIKFDLNETKLDSTIQISSICFNSACPRFKSYQPHFTRDFKNLDDDEYAFRLIFGVSKRERESQAPYFYEYKSTVDINLKYKNKKMLVKLDFTKNLEKHFEEKVIKININFQEGNFEVTDPLNAEIISTNKKVKYKFSKFTKPKVEIAKKVSRSF